MVAKDFLDNKPIVDVLIPAYNEENSVGKVIREIPSLVRQVVVINNNSNDKTKIIASEAGAIVLDEPIQGYGRACLKGIRYLEKEHRTPDIVVFLDADYSDYPAQLLDIIEPILKQNFDMVIGTRAKGRKESGSMTPPQIFGNWLATFLLRKIYNAEYSDLGPFRAIKWNALKELNMEDLNFGWTVEMQIKAAKQALKTTEVPVDYRKRIGVSKISGTVKGVFGAGYKILYTIWKYR